jgi:uncharacterized membrane protein YraQ (UPF0718 family)
MRKSKPDWVLIALFLVVLALAGAAWATGGLRLVVAGLQDGLMSMLGVVPLLIAAFLIAGLAQTLISKELIRRWLGAESGWRGIFIACVAGALIPGGPYVYYPISAGLLKSGAGLGVLAAFITAKNLWSVTRLPLEFALLGPRITMMRFALTFLMPPIMGFMFERLFGRHADLIRRYAP